MGHERLSCVGKVTRFLGRFYVGELTRPRAFESISIMFYPARQDKFYKKCIIVHFL